MGKKDSTATITGTGGHAETEPEYSVFRQATAFWLCVFGGLAGLHRLYIHRYSSGIIQLAFAACTYVASRYTHHFSGHSTLERLALLFALALFGMAADLFVSFFGNTLFSRRFMFIPSRTRFFSGFVVPMPGNSKKPHDPFPNPGSILTYALLCLIALLLAMGMAVAFGGTPAAAFVATFLPGTVSGILWKGDLASLRYNSLSDGEGRALAP